MRPSQIVFETGTYNCAEHPIHVRYNRLFVIIPLSERPLEWTSANGRFVMVGVGGFSYVHYYSIYVPERRVCLWDEKHSYRNGTTRLSFICAPDSCRRLHV